MVQKIEWLLSGCFAIVETEHSAEACAAIDSSSDRDDSSGRLQQPIAYTLLIAFDEIVGNIFSKRLAER